MAEELLEAVERLQSRLSETGEPRKILKTLRRLGELPMTVEILVDTGVGKTVNSFRKHELAGEVAKGLVAKWKKLVPQPSADRPSISHSKEAPRLQAPSRGHHEGSGGGHRRPLSPSPQPEEEDEEEPSYMEMEEEEQQQQQHQEEEEEEMMEEEERGYNRGYSPSPPPQHHHHHQQHQRYSPQPTGGGYQSEEYDDSPPPSPPPVPPSPPPPARSKDAARHGKPHKEPGKNQNQNQNQQQQARGSHGDRRDRERGEERQQKKRSTMEAEPTTGAGPKSAKHSRHATAHEGKREKERGEREEKKKGGADGESERKCAPKEPAAAEEEDFETPTMSFESFLMYDAPTPVKKKKKPSSSSSSSSHSRPSHPSSSSSSSHARTHPAAASSSSSSSSSKPSRSNGTKSSKRSEMVSAPVAATPEKRRRVVDAVATVPDISLPAIQPNYRPRPSLDLMPLSPQRRKVPHANGEEDAGFTGKRLNTKMVVYSGTKTAYLPKMMTLYEQCIRVLQNNIDSIDEVGGVPYEILEPVLERCTPEQLYRIEHCNQCFMEESDELWMRHCQRDFKRSSPQEYESWREMYLRLHDEREERLRMLTQNISSAHANKPKGRQVKMAFVNSVAKPPRDVRRRQEKFGTTTTSTASSTAAAAPIKIRPATSYSSSSDAGHFSSSSSSFPQSSPPHGSSRSSLGGGSAVGGGPPGRDKPQVKKIAPMMAKTIKAFKNRFSRR
ncbi:unnamed protein product [Merluccius merluccius]